MKNHFLKFIIISLLFLTLSFCFFSCQTSGSAQTAPVVKVTDTDFSALGYRLIETKRLEMVQGTAFILEHIKSGALIQYVANDDKNLSFCVTVSTPPEQNNGANHILEHMTLAATKKYPGKEVFEGISNTTLNTYMNASTYSSYIQFPFSSTDERQFTKLADYYLSAVYEPDLNNMVFKREGWRYELENESSPLTINGIVYNEMKGANSNILRALSTAVRETLFPDTVIKNDSGGKTETIPSLSLEQLQAYHDKYFVPSNSIISVYGDLDIKPFLRFLDSEWLSKYEKTIPLVAIEAQKPFEKAKSVYRYFPVTAGTKTTKAAVISKGYAISGIEEKDIPALLLAINILNNTNSSLMQRLKASGIADSYFINLNISTRQPQFEVIAQNVDPARAGTFEKYVTDSFKSVANSGIEQMLFESIKSNYYANALLARENTSIGLELLRSMAEGELAIQSPYAFATASYDVQNVTEQDVRRVVDKYLVKNNHSVLAIMEPKAGLAEEQEQAELKRLENYKKSLSKQGIQKLVSETAAFKRWLSDPDEIGDESVSKMHVLEPDNLTNTLDKVNVYDSKKNGFRSLHVNVTGSAVQTGIILNLSHLSPEELQYADLYLSLLGKLPAGSMSEEEVDYKLSKLVLKVDSAVEPFYTDDTYTNSYPVMGLRWYAEPALAEEAEKLMRTILFSSILEPNKLKVLIAMEKGNADYQIQSNAVVYALRRALAASNPAHSLSDWLSGVPSYRFIQQVYKDVNENAAAVIEKLIDARDRMLVASDPVVITTGNRKIAGESGQFIINKLAAFTEPVQKTYTQIKQPAAKEAFIINDSVNYTVAVQEFDKSDRIAFSITSDILSNEYYTPKIRLEGGAYGGYSAITGNTFCAYSFRDPSLDKTIRTFRTVSNALPSLALTQEKINPYIISRYGILTAPRGVYSKAYSDAVEYLHGITKAMRYDDIEKLKSITAADVSDIISRIKCDDQYTVFGSKSALTGSSLKFDSIVDLVNE